MMDRARTKSVASCHSGHHFDEEIATFIEKEVLDCGFHGSNACMVLPNNSIISILAL